jgi:hypothetical protein
VPQSLIMERAYALTLEEYPDEPDFAESSRLLWWELALKELGIPFTRFVPTEVSDDAIWPVPFEIREQLHDKPAVCAMPVKWNEQDYIVASINCGDDPVEGDSTDIDELQYLHLISAHYIDLDN